MTTIVTFLDLTPGDAVGGQFTNTHGITFSTSPAGTVVFDPKSPFSNALSAARAGGPVEFPTWVMKGTLKSPSHSIFGISVNESVTMTLKDKNGNVIKDYSPSAPKFINDGSFFYGEFATGKANIASFEIHTQSAGSFHIASIVFDTAGVPHKPDFR